MLSYIALFDDMRFMIAQLASINKVARKAWQEVERRAGKQDVFETEIANQPRKEGFLSAAL